MESKINTGKPAPGGLLANVSLLTTGGSSLQQQLTGNDAHLTSTRNQTSAFQLTDGSLQETNIDSSRKNVGKIDTSTPARPLKNKNIIYGFDLSPVHSYEMPSGSTAHEPSITGQATLENKTLKSEEYSMQQPTILDKMEDELFVDSKTKAAPNFMQAAAVPSPHQSRISTRASDETETMMSQVYSRSSKTKSTKSRSPSKKSSSKSVTVGQRSPTYGSPRRTSKLYSHVRGSGYGVMSPWKSITKSKSDEKKKSSVFIPKRKLRSSGKKESSTEDSIPTQTQHRSFATKNINMQALAELRNPADTFKIASPSKQVTHAAEIQDSSVNDTRDEQAHLLQIRQQLEYNNLEERCHTLEKECSRLKAGNTEMNKENFLLSAKLNKLMGDSEIADPLTKDSLNENKSHASGADVIHLRREILEQERLLKGYQQENEKLYTEMAKMKTRNRENETAMFNENLKLKNKIASMKEELVDKDFIIKDKNQLLLDDRNLRPTVVNQYVQTNVPSQIQKNVELTTSNELLKEMQTKLAWHAENEATLEQKCRRLDDATVEVAQLKSLITDLNRELSEKSTGTKNQCQTVEDLRRQVRELEIISLRRSHTSDHVKDLIHGDSEKKLLEQRAQQLEARLKEQEEKFAHSMQSLHDLYKKMSNDYEARVENLSEQLQILKQHTRKPLVNRQANVQQDSLRVENNKLKLQIESMKKALMVQDRKAIISKSTKSQNIQDSTYHPGYFAERPQTKIEFAKVEQDKPEMTSCSNEMHEKYDAMKAELLKEVAHWKKLYVDMKDTYDSFKVKEDTEIELLKSTYKKSMDDIEINISKLQEKVKNDEMKLSRSMADLSSSRACENALQLQIKNLLDELQETRRGSPNVAIRHIESLQAQVRLLDFRQKSREDKLNNAVVTNADEYVKAEISSLHDVIAEKNLLLSKFRYELDSILHVLETLQTRES